MMNMVCYGVKPVPVLNKSWVYPAIAINEANFQVSIVFSKFIKNRMLKNLSQ